MREICGYCGASGIVPRLVLLGCKWEFQSGKCPVCDGLGFLDFVDVVNPKLIDASEIDEGSLS